MNRIIRGTRSIHITPKSMEVLVCLSKREGGVVSRDEILQEVWPGTHVTDDALTKCIGELRRVFHGSAHKPDVIETIPKRGYRAAAPVTWNPDQMIGPPQPSLRLQSSTALLWWRNPRTLLVGCGAVILLAAVLALRSDAQRDLSSAQLIRAIAVLPLANASGDRAQDYFADAATDELITELSQIGAWKVISRTSIMRYKGSTTPLRTIARELGVDGIVEGTIVRSRNRVRITAQLIHAATDAHVWSGSFERDVSDVLSLQSDIARAIAVDLRVGTASGMPLHPSRNRRVVPEAYEPYVKGCYFLERNQFQTAASYFDQAIAIDSAFALAYALLFEADAADRYGQDLPVGDRAILALDKARALDDSLAEVQTGAVAARFFWGWDWAAGETGFLRAAELDRGSLDAAYHYALCLHALGRWDAASHQYQRTRQLDPVSPRMNAQWLSFLIDARRYGEARRQFERTVELDPNNAAAYVQVGRLHQLQGREEEALRAYLKADTLRLPDPDEIRALESAAKANGVRGYWVKQIELLEERARQRRIPPLDFASLYIRIGDKDKAMQMLEAAYQQRAPRLVWIRANSIWDPLRSDPRFERLLGRMRFPE